MRNKVGSIFEIIWLVLGGLMLYIGIDLVSDAGLAGSWYYFLLSGLAFLMYYLRRNMRLRNR